MYTRSANFIRFSLPIFDLFAINFIFVILSLVIQVVGSIEYIILFIAYNIFWLISTFFTALYNERIPKNEKLIPRTIQSFFLYYVFLITLIFLFKFPFSRLFVVLTFVAFGLSLIISRSLFIGANHFIKSKPWFKKKVIVLGYNDISKKLVEHFSKYNQTVEFEGFFDDDRTALGGNNYQLLGNVNNCLSYAIDNRVNEIYSTISPEKNKALYAIAQEAERHFIRFKVVPDFNLFVNRKIHVDFDRGIPIISLRSEPLEDIGSQLKKRFFDVAFSILVVIFILSWLVPLLALVIKLDSQGPVFFVQLRSGKNNKVFKCFKFRSFLANDDENSKQVTRSDKRLTRVGKFLRRTNLDELPQFLNVLLGEMSIIGPRPHMIKHTMEYSIEAETYMLRHFVKPGVTGWAQVNGYRGEITRRYQLNKRIEHDIWYMENWSMLLDCKIILLTLYLTFKGDKNAF